TAVALGDCRKAKNRAASALWLSRRIATGNAIGGCESFGNTPLILTPGTPATLVEKAKATGASPRATSITAAAGLSASAILLATDDQSPSFSKPARPSLPAGSSAGLHIAIRPSPTIFANG